MNRFLTATALVAMAALTAAPALAATTATTKTTTTTKRQMLSTHEVADALGISEGAVRLRLADGEIRSTKLGGRRLIPAAEIDRIVRSAY